MNVGGVKDSGYSLYVDINYADDSHDWGFHLPFNVGTHGWEAVSAYLDKDKPIASLDVYCMFRGHEGAVLFDDVTAGSYIKRVSRALRNLARTGHSKHGFKDSKIQRPVYERTHDLYKGRRTRTQRCKAFYILRSMFNTDVSTR